jgi:anti-anti-sigma factor
MTIEADKKSCVDIEKRGDAAVVRFTRSCVSKVEEITASQQQIKDYADRERPARLVVDFDGVKFFTSQVLGVLLDVRGKLEAYGGKVVVSGINPQLYRVFRITNLDKLFKFYPDADAAIGAGGA